MQLSGKDFEYVNSYADSVLENLHGQMVEKGLDRIPLPDNHLTFSKRRLGVNWEGEAFLRNGQFKGLETLHRCGESAITINMDGVTVDVELGILRSELDYEVDARFMNHGPRGSVSGSLTHVVAHVTLNIQPGTEKVTLKELTVHEIGHLKAKITGLGSILNFLISRILGILGNRVKWKVSSMLEGVIKDLLNEIIATTPLPSTLDVTKLLLPI